MAITANRAFLVVALFVLSFCTTLNASADLPRSKDQKVEGRAALANRRLGPFLAQQRHGSFAPHSSLSQGALLVRPLSGQAPPATNVGFLAAPQISLAGVPIVAAVGNFNSDAKKDVAAIVSNNDGSYSVAVLLGQGDGTFQPLAPGMVTFTSGGRLLAADLNQDGTDDIVVINSGSADVYLSNGDGTFSVQTTNAEGDTDPEAAALSDVNTDGKLDLVIADGRMDSRLAFS
jgi:hypothetical protein